MSETHQRDGAYGECHWTSTVPVEDDMLRAFGVENPVREVPVSHSMSVMVDGSVRYYINGVQSDDVPELERYVLDFIVSCRESLARKN